MRCPECKGKGCELCQNLGVINPKEYIKWRLSNVLILTDGVESSVNTMNKRCKRAIQKAIKEVNEEDQIKLTLKIKPLDPEIKIDPIEVIKYYSNQVESLLEDLDEDVSLWREQNG